MKSVNKHAEEGDKELPKKTSGSHHVAKIKNLVRSAIPLLLLTGAPACEWPTKEPTTVKAPEVLISKLTHEKGNWKFDVMELKEEKFRLEEGQKYFYDYIKAKLSKTTGADLSYSRDLETFTDAYIEITQKLNPELNLNIPEDIIGQKIILPATVWFTPGEGKFLRSRVGYEYLRDAARVDGMDISDPLKRGTIYAEACKLPLMPDSDYYECKDKTSDCKEACATHAQLTYNAFAKEFFEESAGVKPVYNDLMRDEADEKALVEQGKGGTELGSTHITGANIDQAVFRYIINGKQVSYGTATDEQKKDIETRLIPLLKKLLSKYFQSGQMLVLDETHGNAPHYHIYFPRNVTPLHPQEIKLDLTGTVSAAAKTPEKSQEPTTNFPETELYTQEKEGTKFYTFTVPSWKLTRMLDTLCISSSTGTIEAIKKFNKIDHISPGDIIWIPIAFMKPELRNPSLLLVEDPTGISQDIIDLYNPNREAGSYRIPKALLNQQ